MRRPSAGGADADGEDHVARRGEKSFAPPHLGAWINRSVEGARTAQAGGAAPQVALDGHLGW